MTQPVRTYKQWPSMTAHTIIFLTTIQKHWHFSSFFSFKENFGPVNVISSMKKSSVFILLALLLLVGTSTTLLTFFYWGVFEDPLQVIFYLSVCFFFNWTKIWHELYTILCVALALLSGRYNLINKFSTKFCQIAVWIIQKKNQFCRKKITCADIYNIYNSNIITKCRNC